VERYVGKIRLCILRRAGAKPKQALLAACPPRDHALAERGLREPVDDALPETRASGATRASLCIHARRWCTIASLSAVRRPTPGDEDMIKVSVMYPNTRGARFNHEYYRDKHMPLVKARMGEKCKHYTVDKGIAGGTPDAPATYIAMCHLFCDSVESFQAGFGPHAKEIMADIPKYTDLSPVIQISEVVVG
jgi:uncharacterized protein (TIGR02118 family)